MSGQRPAASVRGRGEAWQALWQRTRGGRATATSILTRSAARLEDEGGPRGRRLAADDTVVEDDDAAIEQFAHLDGEPGEGAPAAELHEPRAEADGVVAGHDATVAAAEDHGEIARRSAPDGRRLRGRFAEAPIEVRDEFGQVGLGRLDRANGAQAQFADEPILQGGPQPLDAAFGLGRARADIADGERVQDAAEMRRPLHARELFLDRPVWIIPDEEIQPIPVHGEREPVLREDAAKERGIAMDILGGAELQGEDLAGGVIDGAEQNELGAAGLEPGKGTAVDLNQGAAGGLRDAPAPHLGRSPRVLRWLPELLPHASHRFARQREAVLLAQLFGQ